MSVNLYLTMQSLDVLLTFLPLLLTAREVPSYKYVQPFVKCPANSVSLLYDQYIHDLSRILNRQAPLVSSLKMKQCAAGCQRAIALQSHSDIKLNVLGKKIKVNTKGMVFGMKSPGVIALRTGTRLSIIGNLSPTTAMIPRRNGRSYRKSYIDPTALLCPLVNPRSH